MWQVILWGANFHYFCGSFASHENLSNVDMANASTNMHKNYIDPSQFFHKIGNSWISPYMGTPLLPSCVPPPYSPITVYTSSCLRAMFSVFQRLKSKLAMAHINIRLEPFNIL